MSFSAQALLNYRTARSVIFSELCKVVKVGLQYFFCAWELEVDGTYFKNCIKSVVLCAVPAIFEEFKVF